MLDYEYIFRCKIGTRSYNYLRICRHFYITLSKIIVLTQRAYRRKYRSRTAPKSYTIRCFWTWICSTLRTISKITPTSFNENIQGVLEILISGITLRPILKKNLKMFPYKVKLSQRLLETDESLRLTYAKNVIRIEEVDFLEETSYYRWDTFFLVWSANQIFAFEAPITHILFTKHICTIRRWLFGLVFTRKPKLTL